MHLLFDARLLHRSLSGLERVQRNVLRELSRHPDVRRLRALVRPGTRVPDGLETVEFVEVATTEDILAELLHEDRDQRPDVYHLTWFPDRNPRDVLLPLAAPASVVEVHDAILNRHPEYHPELATWEWYHRFVCRLVHNCDRLLVHSKSVAGEIVQDLQGDGAIVDVAPLAVDPALREPLPQSVVQKRLKRMGVDASSPYFVALGKDYPHKDHATMFRALARLGTKNKGLHVVCAGSKVWHEPGATTDELLARLKIEDRVSWVHEIPDDDVKALIQGSKALIYPSREEGFGLPPIEAMALGTPVAAARSMSVPEVCGDGALLFEPGNDEELAGVMETLLAGGESIQELVARGHAKEEEYSWKRCADATVDCYRRAIEAAKTRRFGHRDLWESLSIASQSPHSDDRELSDWQKRCLGAEQHARDIEVDRDHILEKLRELEARVGRPPTTATPLQSDNGRPRWSLRRRIGKIRDGLKRYLGRT